MLERLNLLGISGWLSSSWPPNLVMIRYTGFSECISYFLVARNVGPVSTGMLWLPKKVPQESTFWGNGMSRFRKLFPTLLCLKAFQLLLSVSNDSCQFQVSFTLSWCSLMSTFCCTELTKSYLYLDFLWSYALRYISHFKFVLPWWYWILGDILAYNELVVLGLQKSSSSQDWISCDNVLWDWLIILTFFATVVQDSAAHSIHWTGWTGLEKKVPSFLLYQRNSVISH